MGKDCSKEKIIKEREETGKEKPMEDGWYVVYVKQVLIAQEVVPVVDKKFVGLNVDDDQILGWKMLVAQKNIRREESDL